MVLTVGLAAAIAGLFGSLDEVTKERHERRAQQCELAEKVVAGTLDGVLVSDAVKRHLLSGAYERLDTCLRR